MKGIGFAHLADAASTAGYAAPTAALIGDATSSLVTFDEFPLWAVRADLEPGAALLWSADHGDEGIYVVSGHLEVDERLCPADGAVVVESGVAAEARAPVGATVVHFGPVNRHPPTGGSYGPPVERPRRVHITGPRGTYAAVEPGRDTRIFADSTCETCRITLFFTGRDAAYVSDAHSHSADEILYLFRGEIFFGSRRLVAGDAVAIRAHQRYAFRSGENGFAFLNHRSDASEQTLAGGVPLLEGGRARGLSEINDTW